MAKERRNFNCPNTGEACDDSRCKQTRCALDADTDASKSIKATDAEMRRILEDVARRNWQKPHRPHESDIEALMQHPAIRAEAEQIFSGRYNPWWYKRQNSN